MDPGMPVHDEISRRSMLKRLGAGAAVAWSAPVISSLGRPAFAQTTPVCDPVDCEAFPCGDFERPCGENPDTGPCICALTVEGGCECFQPICLEDDDCELGEPCREGYACVNQDCCGYSFCAALCNTPISSEVKRANRRWG